MNSTAKLFSLSALVGASVLNLSAADASVIITVRDAISNGEINPTAVSEPAVFEVPLEKTEKGWTIPHFEALDPDRFKVSLDGSLNMDPSIIYGLAVVDFGAPSDFTFSFFTPIVPTGPATTVSSELVGGLLDGGTDGVSITPFLQASVQVSTVSAPTTSMGVDIGPAASFPVSAPYGLFSGGPIPGPAGGPWTGLDATASFTLAGGGDAAVLAGKATVVDAVGTGVPDGAPGSTALVVTLAGMFAAARICSRKQLKA